MAYVKLIQGTLWYLRMACMSLYKILCGIFVWLLWGLYKILFSTYVWLLACKVSLRTLRMAWGLYKDHKDAFVWPIISLYKILNSIFVWLLAYTRVLLTHFYGLEAYTLQTVVPNIAFAQICFDQISCFFSLCPS